MSTTVLKYWEKKILKYVPFRFLNSLIFNDSVDAYQNWTLFLIFVFILVLIGGVVLLTHKKPDAGEGQETKLGALPKRRPRSASTLAAKKAAGEDSDDDESEGRALRAREEGDLEAVDFELGDVSDSDDEMDDGKRKPNHLPPPVPSGSHRRPEEAGLMAHDDEDGIDDHHPAPESSRPPKQGSRSPERRSSESDKTLARDEDSEEFGEWKASESR